MSNGRRTNIGMAALIIGIVGIVIIWIPFVSFASIVLGILAIVFGALAYWGKNRKDPLGLAGFILGLITIILIIITVVIAATVYVYISGMGEHSVIAPPSVTLKLSDADQYASGDGFFADGEDVLIVEHAGGDMISLLDLEIQYRAPGGSEWRNIEEADSIDGDDNLEYTSYFYILSVGETLTISADGNPLTGKYDLRIIHNPSQAFIAMEYNLNLE